MFKKYEGRLYKGCIKNLKVDDNIYICYKKEQVLVKIINIRIFNNFEDILTFSDNSLSLTLPYCKNLEEGINLYKNIYKSKKIEEYGTVSIEIKVI